MIEYIKGITAYLNEEYAAIETSGIAYKVYITSRAAGVLKKGEEVTLYTYMNITQQYEVILYGFLQLSERQMFEKLISVSGVGPKAAMSILSAMSLSQITTALVSNDSKSFSRANGVGPKTANRIVLELRDKVEISDILGDDSPAIAPQPVSDYVSEAMEALMGLGYSRQEAMKAVSAVRNNASTAEELTLLALKQISL